MLQLSARFDMCTVPAPYLCASLFSFENLLFRIFQARNLLSPVSRISTYVSLNLKAVLDLHSATDHLEQGWLEHLAWLHRGTRQSQRQNSAVSLDHINETAICIAFPNPLLHGAHTFAVHSPARPATSLPPEHKGVPPAPDEADPSEIAHDSVSQCLCKATNRNTAG